MENQHSCSGALHHTGITNQGGGVIYRDRLALSWFAGLSAAQQVIVKMEYETKYQRYKEDRKPPFAEWLLQNRSRLSEELS